MSNSIIFFACIAVYLIVGLYWPPIREVITKEYQKGYEIFISIIFWPIDLMKIMVKK